MMFGFTPKWNPQSTVDFDNPVAKDFSTALIQAREKAVSSLIKATEVMQTYYNEKRDNLPPLEVGTKVWLDGRNITPFHPMKKLAEKRYGPFKVLERIGPSSYKLKLLMMWKGIHPVFNEVLLVPFHQPLQSQSMIQPPPEVHPDHEDRYEVEQILDTRKFCKTQKYLVKWRRFGHEENTWEPLKNLKGLEEALAAFRESRKKTSAKM